MNKKQTNYIRIKNMSIEEMAEFMYSASDEICFANCMRDTGNKFSCKLGDDCGPENCKKCMMEYLESEVTKNDKLYSRFYNRRVYRCAGNGTFKCEALNIKK